MNKNIKGGAKILFFAGALCIGAYGAYRLYDYILEDAIKKIQKGVSKGVSKGIGKSIRTIINPFKWF